MRNLGLVISLPANSIVVANSLCQFAELKKKKEKKKGFPTNIAATRENHSSPTSSLVAAAGRRKHFIISRPNPRSLSFSHMSVSPSAKDMQIQPNEAEKPMKPKVLTLVIIEKEGEVLLGMKKRGFGQGYYNGFGGKVETGETVEEAAARELKEEAGVVAVSMEKRGILTFHFDDNPQPWEVHVYHVPDFVGEPCESEEMAPVWFSYADIPYDRMWQDDQFWYPEFLQGRRFRGEFYFHNTHTLVSHSLQSVAQL
jgi:8-oxo-dGTP pyrophosphatase MutT (NUDIX family)